ncbi:MAG: Ig-like domain-containing protein [Candidatus Coprovivens sp.]
MKNNKKIFNLLIALVTVIMANITVVYAEIKECEYTEEYKEWISTEHDTMAIAPQKCVKEENLFTRVTKYSLREANLETKYLSNDISIVKNQENTETCWAFSTTTLIENYNKKIDLNIDDIYSPTHIEYFTANKDYFTNYVGIVNGRTLNQGGNYYIAASYLLNNNGAILEEKMPFENYKEKIKNKETVDASKIDSTVAVDVNKMVLYKNKDDTCETNGKIIKNAIKEYGSVGISIYYDNRYLDENFVYKYTGSNDPNHAITLIGWDDDVKAFIAQNSYGTDYGKQITVDDKVTKTSGYFYLSYEDVNACNDYAYIADVDDQLNDYSISYGGLKGTNTLTINSDSAVAYAIFDRSSDYEELKEVNVINEGNTTINIYKATYSNGEFNYNNEDLIGTQNFQEDGTVYQTIKLTKPIIYDKDDGKIVLAIEYKNPGNEASVTVTENVIGGGFYDNITISEGTTFLKNGNSVIDLANFTSSDNKQVSATLAIGIGTDKININRVDNTTLYNNEESYTLKFDISNLENIEISQVTINKTVNDLGISAESEQFDIVTEKNGNELILTLTPKADVDIIGNYQVTLTLSNGSVLTTSFDIEEYVRTDEINFTKGNIVKKLILDKTSDNYVTQIPNLISNIEGKTPTSTITYSFEVEAEGFQIDSTTGIVTYDRPGIVIVKATADEVSATYTIEVKESAIEFEITDTEAKNDLRIMNKTDADYSTFESSRLYYNVAGKLKVKYTGQQISDKTIKLYLANTDEDDTLVDELTYTDHTGYFDIDIPEILYIEGKNYYIEIVVYDKDTNYTYKTITKTIDLNLYVVNKENNIDDYEIVGSGNDKEALYKEIGGKIYFNATYNDFDFTQGLSDPSTYSAGVQLYKNNGTTENPIINKGIVDNEDFIDYKVINNLLSESESYEFEYEVSNRLEAGNYCLVSFAEINNQTTYSEDAVCFTVHDEYKAVEDIYFTTGEDSTQEKAKTEITIDKDDTFKLNVFVKPEEATHHDDVTIYVDGTEYENQTNIIYSEDKMISFDENISLGDHTIKVKSNYDNVEKTFTIHVVDAKAIMNDLNIVGNFNINENEIYSREDGIGGGNVTTTITFNSYNGSNVIIQAKVTTDNEGNVGVEYEDTTLEITNTGSTYSVEVPSNTPVGTYCIIATANYDDVSSNTVEKCFEVKSLSLIKSINLKNTENERWITDGESVIIEAEVETEDGTINYPELKWESSSSVVTMTGEDNLKKTITGTSSTGVSTITISLDKNYSYDRLVNGILTSDVKYTCGTKLHDGTEVLEDTECYYTVSKVDQCPAGTTEKAGKCLEAIGKVTQNAEDPDDYICETGETYDEIITAESDCYIEVPKESVCPADSTEEGGICKTNISIAEIDEENSTYTCDTENGFTLSGTGENRKCTKTETVTVEPVTYTVHVINFEVSLSAEVKGNKELNPNIIYTDDLGSIVGKVSYNDPSNEIEEIVIKNKETNAIVTEGFEFINQICTSGTLIEGKCKTINEAQQVPVEAEDCDADAGEQYDSVNKLCFIEVADTENEKVSDGEPYTADTCPGIFQENKCYETKSETTKEYKYDYSTCDESDEENHTCTMISDPTGYTDSDGNNFKIVATSSVQPGEYYLYTKESFIDPTNENRIVTYSEKTFDFKVEEYKELTEITVNPTKVYIKVGENEEISPIFNPIDASLKAVTYTSNDLDVVTVDEDGIITAVAKGTTTIDITSVKYPEITTSLEVVVVDPTVTVTPSTEEDDIYHYYGGTINGTFTFNDDVKPETILIKVLDSNNEDMSEYYTIKKDLNRKTPIENDRTKTTCSDDYTYNEEINKCIKLIDANEKYDECPENYIPGTKPGECYEYYTPTVNDIMTCPEGTTEKAGKCIEEIGKATLAPKENSEDPDEYICETGITDDEIITAESDCYIEKPKEKTGENKTCLNADEELNEDETKCVHKNPVQMDKIYTCDDESSPNAEHKCTITEEPTYDTCPTGYEVKEDETKCVESEPDYDGNGKYTITIDKTMPAGNYNIVVSGEYVSGDSNNVKNIAKTPIEIKESELTITNKKTEMLINKTHTLVVNSTPNVEYEYSSSDEEVATIIDGVITANKVGTTTIRVSSKTAEELYDEYTLTVVDPITVGNILITLDNIKVEKITEGDEAIISGSAIINQNLTELKISIYKDNTKLEELTTFDNEAGNITFTYNTKDLKKGTYKFMISGIYDTYDVLKETSEFTVEEKVPTKIDIFTFEDGTESKFINNNDKYITNISIKMTDVQFVSELNLENVDYEILKSSNSKDYLGSGTQLIINPNTENEKVYTLIIFGDVNGDGDIQANDYMMIKNSVLSRTNSSIKDPLANDKVRTFAADVKQDNDILANDYMMIKNCVLSRTNSSIKDPIKQNMEITEGE